MNSPALDVRGLVSRLNAQLQGAGIETSRVEAEWLLADTLGMRRTELYLWDQPIPAQQLDEISQRLARRVGGEPLQYILESCEFCGHRFRVSPGVFIPRPETEVLAQLAIGWLRKRARHSDRAGTLIAGEEMPRDADRATAASPKPLQVLELGTGSGCVAVSLAKAVPACVVVAVELSWKALQAARTNVLAHRLDHRIRIVQSDWSAGIRGPFELVVSNPPYVPNHEVDRAHDRPAERSERSAFGPSRHKHRWRGNAARCRSRGRGFSEAASGDPEMSLKGGADGMMFHRRLLAEAARLLSPGGALVMECAEAQARPLQVMAEAAPWTKTSTIYHDLAGRPRGLFIESVESV